MTAMDAQVEPDRVAASFAIILGACRDAVGLNHGSPADPTLRRPFDPAALVQLASWHRVLPFVHRFLVAHGITLPPALDSALCVETRAARMTAMMNAAAEAGLAKAAGEAGLDMLFVKGATLGHRLYDDPFAKTSWDIDVLVARTDLMRGCSVLRGLGYRPDLPRGVVDGPRLSRWLRSMRETVWRHPTRGTVVELHVGLSQTPSVLNDVGMRSSRQMVSIHGTQVATLADNELFAFLSVHGTAHGWARLKWLTDVAALIGRSGRSVADLRETGIASGAGRCGDVALLLCHQLLGMDIPDALLATMTRDRSTRRMVAYSLGLIDRVGDPTRRLAAETVPQVLASIRHQCRFAPGPRAWLRTVWANWNKSYSASQLWVPEPLLPVVMIVWLPIYVLLRPFRRKTAAPGQRRRSGRWAPNMNRAADGQPIA